MTRPRWATGPARRCSPARPRRRSKAAAEAAVPGATVIRAETDAQGAAYEVHLKKADGSEVTVKLDASFKVTAIRQASVARRLIDRLPVPPTTHAAERVEPLER